MTQDALAKAAHVSRMTVWRAENGTPIDGDTIRKLAKALRISVRRLTTSTPPPDAPESPDAPDAPDAP
jgi:transcriptional regulator with XRE-family HTH domain